MPTPGTLLAFDFGERRIGVAVGESALGLAHPLTTIDTPIVRDRFAAIEALLAEWKPVALVVGLPLALDGSEHAMSARCRRFANQLNGRFRLPVALVDERLSSAEAEERLRAGGHTAKSARPHLDAAAAQVILQTHFAQSAAAGRSPTDTTDSTEFDTPAQRPHHAPPNPT